MRTDLPQSIQQSAHELSPDALVELFKIQLQNGSIIRVSPAGDITWQGDLYEEIACNITGIGQNSDAQANRPKFSFVNPEGVFSATILEGQMDAAAVTRIRILKADLDNDLDFAITETFQVSRVIQMGQEIVVLELRDVLDGQRFQLPARAYIPPEFPHVKLQ